MNCNCDDLWNPFQLLIVTLGKSPESTLTISSVVATAKNALIMLNFGKKVGLLAKNCVNIKNLYQKMHVIKFRLRVTEIT